MSKGFTKYKITDQNALHFLSIAVVAWIDVFNKRIYKDIIVDSLKYCQQNKGLELFSWVIMSNHIHLVARAKPGFRLSDILRDFKKYTSKKITDAIIKYPESRKEILLNELKQYAKQNPKNTSYQIWRNDNHPVILYSNKVISQKIRYIHNNPVESGLVDNPKDYIYSSARNYAGRIGLVDVIILPL